MCTKTFVKHLYWTKIRHRFIIGKQVCSKQTYIAKSTQLIMLIYIYIYNILEGIRSFRFGVIFFVANCSEYSIMAIENIFYPEKNLSSRKIVPLFDR